MIYKYSFHTESLLVHCIITYSSVRVFFYFSLFIHFVYIGFVVICFCSRHSNKGTRWIPNARRAIRALNPSKVKNTTSPSIR